MRYFSSLSFNLFLCLLGAGIAGPAAAQDYSNPHKACFAKEANPSRRIAACNEILPNAKVDFGKALVIMNRGNARFANRDFAGAEADYDKAEKLNPRDANIFYHRAEARRWQKNYQPAITDYNKAVEIKDDFLEAYYRRGFTFLITEDYPRAIADFEKVIELYHWHAKAMHAMAWIYANAADRQVRNGEKAVHWGLRATDLRKNDAEMYETLAAAYEEAGQHDKALETYETVMELGGSYWVKYYQNRLRKRGYRPGPADGKYGKKTRVAIAKCIKKGCRLGAK